MHAAAYIPFTPHAARLPRDCRVTRRVDPPRGPAAWTRRVTRRVTRPPRRYWSVQATLELAAPSGPVPLDVTAVGGALWDEKAAAAKLAAAAGGGGAACVADAVVESAVEAKPLPLNTLAMLRAASDRLGIGPGDAMHYGKPRRDVETHAPPRRDAPAWHEGPLCAEARGL